MPHRRLQDETPISEGGNFRHCHTRTAGIRFFGSMCNACVLIVDDQADFCRLLARVVQKAGYEAICLTSGPAALDYLKEHTPNLIILDMMMPGMDGLDVLSAIRGDARVRQEPVVMFSAVADPAFQRRAIETGANDWWLKANIDY